MIRAKAALFCAAATVAVGSMGSSAFAADDGAKVVTTVPEVIVTANKKSENIQNVGMSIQAATGAQLTKAGITDVSQLNKIVAGFNYAPSPLGTPVFSVRGVNFYDEALAANPAVSLYSDEVPLPYSIMATGAFLDVQRVEVLKGPQGTLYGENATGGAINFITNKPTPTFTAGADASFSRFNTADLQGFVSGPVTDTLGLRLALHTVQSGPWQESYTRDASSGNQNLTNGRLIAEWAPNAKLKVDLTLSGFIDRTESQQSQLYAVVPSNPAQADPRLLSYPLAPHNDRAADWSRCVNDSPLDPPYNTAGKQPISPTSCVGYQRDNTQYTGALRVEYELPDGVKFTSITSHEHFDIDQPMDLSGTDLQGNQSIQRGYLISTFQEFRLTGSLYGRGSWIAGVNYDHDNTFEQYMQSTADSSLNPLFGLVQVNTSRPLVGQTNNIYAGYISGDFRLTDALTLQGGVRYTQDNETAKGCLEDSGNGQMATAFDTISYLGHLLIDGNPNALPANIPAGSCVTLGPAPGFIPGIVNGKLDQNNLSWKSGLNWKLTPGICCT